MKQKSKAPALAHGIDVLMLLSQHNQLTLESISHKLDLPKSSLLRYMDTLVDYALVSRSPSDKQYSLADSFLTNGHTQFQLKLEHIMATLCDDTQCTCEWYELEHGQIILKKQLAYEGHQIKISATEGFVREFGPELEAVNRIFLSHHTTKLSTEDYWAYDEKQQRQAISNDQAIASMKQTILAYKDDYANSNGIRRMAKAVYKDNKLYGVLALAQITFLPQVDTWENIFQKLQNIELGD